MTRTLDLRSLPNNVDDASALRAFVENLFHGWGYNAYRDENKLRADDLLVRGEISNWLSTARAEVSRQESEYRRAHLKPPTREAPVPDAAALDKARSYVRLGQRIEALEVAVRHAPAPEDDRVWRRHRNEAAVLERLVRGDLEVAQAALEVLRAASQADVDPDAEWSCLDRLTAALAARAEVLSIFAS